MTVRSAYDVVVVGGGTAGIAAAVSAARLGANVLLAERSEVLGGNATNALVHTFCGLFLPATNGNAVYAHHGFPRRFAEGLLAAGGGAPPERAGKAFVLPIFPALLERFAVATCDQAPGLTWWTDCEVVAAALAREAGDANALECVRAGDRFEVEGRVLVDTSGDGVVAALGGAAFTVGAPSELQCPSFIFHVTGVDPSAVHGFARLKVTVAAAGAVKLGDLPPGCESVLIRPGRLPGEAYVTLNMPKLDGRPYDPLDAAYVAELGALGRTRATALLAYLSATRPAFQKVRLLGWPRRVGIRETRRLCGREVMSAQDILEGRRSADEVAVSSWPIELWNDHRRAEFHYPEAASSIPLGALVSQSHPMLGMAGRCMSATHEALGALRVIGTAMATGEAVGVAAALAADQDCGLAAVSPVQVRQVILRGGEEAA